MRVITRKRLHEFASLHPETSSALDNWYRALKSSSSSNFSELKQTWSGVDKVDQFTVFDVGGNKVRIIAFIDYKRQILYIRHVLTHSEYDKNKWRE